MANFEHLKTLREGSTLWNRWRDANPDVVPDLTDASLERAALPSVNLRRCRLARSSFHQAVLAGANLADADLIAANFLAADLSSADLRGANLSNAICFQANVRDARLETSKLYSADLRNANFSEATFRGADLTVADFRGANLSGADFGGADIGGTNLAGSIVSGANFAGAIAWQTIFGSIDLSRALGLDQIQHVGPSILGIDTLFQSDGEIPEIFLRGCGVPERFITYIHQLVGKSIEFYSCFLSYSTKDEEFVERLYADLQSRGVRCWFAPPDVRGGRRIREQIDEAIRLADRVLLVLSEASLSSEWVKVEIAAARRREMAERRQVLFPISLVPFERLRDWSAFQPESHKDLGRELREYFIPDFSQWRDHDAYLRAASKLLKSLVTSVEPINRPGAGRA